MSVLDRITDDRPTACRTLVFAYDPADSFRLAEAQRTTSMWQAVASASDDETPEQLQARVAEAKDEYDALLAEVPTIHVTLQGIGPVAFRELVDGHPASKADKAKGRAKVNGSPAGEPPWNEDTFPPALLAATVARIEVRAPGSEPDVQDGLDADGAVKLWTSTWSEGDKVELFRCACSLDSDTSLVEDLGNG